MSLEKPEKRENSLDDVDIKAIGEFPNVPAEAREQINPEQSPRNEKQITEEDLRNAEKRLG